MKSFFALTGSGLCFTLSSQEGVNTVPGAIALHLIFCLTKSDAIDFVSPIIAALLAPYTNLFGSPLILDATEATLIILPPLLFIIVGNVALHIKYIDLILVSKEKSQSFSSQSKIVP